MKIQAAVAHSDRSALSIEVVELAKPGPGEVLLRVVATGLCHTDLSTLDTAPLPWPAILGHDGAGIIEAVGPGVSGLEVGDHAILTTASYGTCRCCTAGEPSYCTNFMSLNMSGGRRADGSCTHSQLGQPVFAGFLGQSSFATHILARERSVILVDRDLPLDVLAPLGCGVQTGAGAVLNTLRPHPGSSFAVFGAGAVGLSALMAARIAGCDIRIAIDRLAARLELARELGATHVIDVSTADAVEAVREITGGGADYVVEAAGHPMVTQQSVAATGRRGTVAHVGVARGSKVEVDVSFLQGTGVTIKGSLMAGEHADPQEFLVRLIRYWREGQMPFDKLVSFFRFEQVNEAIHDVHEGRAIKAVLRMSENDDGTG